MSLNGVGKETIIREQCENLSSCLEQLTRVIAQHPGRKELYLLQTLMEETLTKIYQHYHFNGGGYAQSTGSRLRRIW